MATLQETLDNANAIMKGEKKIEVDANFTLEGAVILAITLVVSYVIIFGIARLMKPYK